MDCGETVTERIPALGHDRVYEPAIEATCETSGRTGRVVCDRCGMVLEEGETIPPLGHEIEGDECINCGKEACMDLEFKIGNDGSYYILIGLGDCTDTHILVPDVYDDGENGEHPVKSIKIEAFSSKKNGVAKAEQIVTISFPDSIEDIGNDAFRGCSNLVSVTFGRGVWMIGSNAFGGCDSLTAVQFRGDTSDWRVSTTLTDTVGTSIDPAVLSSPSRAAELFTETYASYIWWLGTRGYSRFRL